MELHYLHLALSTTVHKPNTKDTMEQAKRSVGVRDLKALDCVPIIVKVMPGDLRILMTVNVCLTDLEQHETTTPVFQTETWSDTSPIEMEESIHFQ